MRTLLLVLLALTLSGAERATRRIIIVVMDGPRLTETWGVTISP